MTLDQQINIWNAIGTWVAGIGTLSAVIVSLYLSSRSQRLNVKAHAGLRLIFAGDGSPPDELVEIGIVNHGDRTVVIKSVGWKIGRGKNARYCLQLLSGAMTDQYPKQLVHGESASFQVSFNVTPDWVKVFATGFLRGTSPYQLKTLRALIHTSLGQTIEVIPESGLVSKLRSFV